MRVLDGAHYWETQASSGRDWRSIFAVDNQLFNFLYPVISFRLRSSLKSMRAPWTEHVKHLLLVSYSVSLHYTLNAQGIPRGFPPIGTPFIFVEMDVSMTSGEVLYHYSPSLTALETGSN